MSALIEKEIITLFCIVDDTLKSLNSKDEYQSKISSSEVLTTAVAACLYFGGNYRFEIYGTVL